MNQPASPEDRSGCLYMLSFPSGRSYVGVTTMSLSDRFKKHARAARGDKKYPILMAFRKYKSEEIKRKVLLFSNDWNYLCEMERKAIKAFGTYCPNGYNATLGGDGAFGAKRTEDTKRRIGIAGKGRIVSAETRMKISAGMIKRLQAKRDSNGGKLTVKKQKAETIEKNRLWHIGKCHSDETKLKMSISQKLYRERNAISEQPKGK